MALVLGQGTRVVDAVGYDKAVRMRRLVARGGVDSHRVGDQVLAVGGVLPQSVC